MSGRRTCPAPRWSMVSNGTCASGLLSSRNVLETFDERRATTTGRILPSRTTTRKEKNSDSVRARGASVEHLGPIDASWISLIRLKPYPHQREILEGLEAERALHDRWRNLVVMATGTGKTIVAAIDYRQLRAANMVRLAPVRRTSRTRSSSRAGRCSAMCMRDGSFGERFVGGRASHPVAARVRIRAVAEPYGLIEGLAPDRIRHGHRGRVPPLGGADVRTAAQASAGRKRWSV